MNSNLYIFVCAKSVHAENRSDRSSFFNLFFFVWMNILVDNLEFHVQVKHIMTRISFCGEEFWFV